MSDASQKSLALVTGASRGLGAAIAEALAAAGHHVIAVARTVGGLEALDDRIQQAGGSATLVPLDLKDMDAIDRLGASIYERWGKLDVLVGNAAILGGLRPLGHVEPKRWDESLAVNVTANWRLIRSLDPLLRRAEAGRAVFVTSSASWNCRPYWGPYSVTKAALDALVRTYASEVQGTAVRANLFNPGPVQTKMRAEAFPGEDPDTLPSPKEVAAALVPLTRADWTETGKVFDFRSNDVLEHQVPA